MTVPTVVVCSSARRFAGARWFSGAIPFLTRWLLANELGRPFCSATGRVVRLRSIHADAFQHQQRFHDRRIYRLDEHQVDACRAALPAAPFIGVLGDRDDQALFSGKVESQLSCDLAPVYDRDGNIQKHHIGVLGRSHSQGGGAIAGRVRSVSPATDQLGERVGRVLLVIDNQDPERSPAG